MQEMCGKKARNLREIQGHCEDAAFTFAHMHVGPHMRSHLFGVKGSLGPG